jgi:hypothetical protein
MTKEIIEKFLDKAGVTPGPWSRQDEGLYISNGWYGVCTAFRVSDSNIIAASREMLVALIFDTISFADDTFTYIDYDRNVSIIEKTLPGYTWEGIKEELERKEEIK